VCSVQLNQTISNQFEALSREGKNKNKMWQRKLEHFAAEANVTNPGPLDHPAGSLKHMPEELRDIRHYRIGDHRVFVTGAHKDCTYQAWYIKQDKKSGVLGEGTSEFQRILTNALKDAPCMMLLPTGDTVPVPIEDQPL